jgi:hypothetical protein
MSEQVVPLVATVVSLASLWVIIFLTGTPDD